MPIFGNAWAKRAVGVQRPSLAAQSSESVVSICIGQFTLHGLDNSADEVLLSKPLEAVVVGPMHFGES